METITVNRGATNNQAKRVNSSSHTIEGFFAWGAAQVSRRTFIWNTTGQESATITAELYVPQGTDIQARDRLTRANGQTYAVVGHALWGENFPLDDAGFDEDLDELVVFQVVSING